MNPQFLKIPQLEIMWKLKDKTHHKMNGRKADIIRWWQVPARPPLVILLSTSTTTFASINLAASGVHTTVRWWGHDAVQSSGNNTFYEQLLTMAAQKGARQKRSKVHKDLSQQGSHLLQGPLQLCSYAVKQNTSRQKSHSEMRQLNKSKNESEVMLSLSPLEEEKSSKSLTVDPVHSANRHSVRPNCPGGYRG